MKLNPTQPIFAVVIREPSNPASITVLRTSSITDAITMAESLSESEITDITLTDTGVEDYILLEYTFGMLYKTHTHTIGYAS